MPREKRHLACDNAELWSTRTFGLPAIIGSARQPRGDLVILAPQAEIDLPAGTVLENQDRLQTVRLQRRLHRQRNVQLCA